MTLNRELSRVSEETATELAEIIIGASADSVEGFQGSLALAYIRNGELVLDEVDSTNPHMIRNGNEGYILTVSVHIPEWDPRFELIKPLIAETIQEKTAAKRARLEAEQEELRAKRVAVAAELAAIDAQLATK